MGYGDETYVDTQFYYPNKARVMRKTVLQDESPVGGGGAESSRFCRWAYAMLVFVTILCAVVCRCSYWEGCECTRYKEWWDVERHR